MVKLPRFTIKNLILLVLLLVVSWIINLFGRIISSETGVQKANAAQCWELPPPSDGGGSTGPTACSGGGGGGGGGY